MAHKNAFFLTGPPGCGKTTVIRKVLERVGRKAGGFYTREIREGGVRKGFKIITLDGKEAVMSHVDFRFPEKVGKYGVDVESVERVAVPAVEKAVKEDDIIVIDEIGKMELFSHAFKDAVFDALGSGKIILGTILYTKHLWADEIRHLPGVELIMVTPKNRDGIVDMLVGMVEELC
jgi:nucleoside-triphosphatase